MLCRVHGKGLFNLGEAAQILDIGINNIRHYLEKDGITVKKVGQSKKLNAYQIAEFMCTGRTSAIDTTSRGNVIGVEVKISASGR